MIQSTTQVEIASEQYFSLGQSIYSDEILSPSLNWANHKLIYFGVTISAILHFGLGSTFWQDIFLSTGKNKLHTPVTVELLKRQIQANDNALAQTKPEEDELQNPLQQLADKKTISQTTHEATIPSENVEQQQTKKPTIAQANKKILVENIFASVREDKGTLRQTSQFHRSNFIVTDPELQKQLDKQLNEQKRKKQIGELGQTEKANKRYAFKPQGNSQVVRLNGQCYQVQKTDAFSLISIPWTYMGNCEKLEKLDFKSRKLDKEYLDAVNSNP